VAAQRLDLGNADPTTLDHNQFVFGESMQDTRDVFLRAWSDESGYWIEVVVVR